MRARTSPASNRANFANEEIVNEAPSKGAHAPLFHSTTRTTHKRAVPAAHPGDGGSGSRTDNGDPERDDHRSERRPAARRRRRGGKPPPQRRKQKKHPHR